MKAVKAFIGCQGPNRYGNLDRAAGYTDAFSFDHLPTDQWFTHYTMCGGLFDHMEVR